jgi:MFS family permease
MSEAAAQASSPWAPLRHPVFRSIWLASLISSIGSTMNDTAAVWTMSTLSASPLLLSVMATVSAVPIFLFSLPAGALADVLDRRRILLVAQSWMLLAAMLLSAAAWLGEVRPWVLIAVAAALGTGVAFNSPAWTSIMPDLVAFKEMPAAVTLGSLSLNISRAIGPAFAGALIAASGPAVCFSLNAASFLVVLLAIQRWRPERKPEPLRAERFLGALAAACRYAAHAPAMQTVLARTFSFVLCGVAVTSLLPIQATHRLHLPASQFGLLMGAFGCGAITMAVAVLPRLRARLSPDALLNVAAIALGAVLLAMTVANQLALLLPVTFCGGAAWIAGISNLSVAGQNAMPPWARGRMNALFVTVMQGSIALGGLLWGQITSSLGLTVALTAAGVLLIATALLVFPFPLSLPYGLDLSAAPPVTSHPFSGPPGPDDGPIVVMVEYQVPPPQAAGFLAAMKPLRLHRLRDGAVRWSVTQEMGEPTRFIEEFTVGSWAEHLRQHERMAVSDKEIHARVRSFHSGEEAPRVRHFIARDVRVPAAASSATKPVT